MEKLNNLLYGNHNTTLCLDIIVFICAFILISLSLYSVLTKPQSCYIISDKMMLILCPIMCGLYIILMHPTLFNHKVELNKLNSIYNITYIKDSSKLKLNKVENVNRAYINEIEFDVYKEITTNTYTLRNERKQIELILSENEFKDVLNHSKIETKANIDEIK